ncbi:uncharacterized protein [Nicotiana sylvestris]|uniref:uncharacterized protein n=1 Tax=Nicotiana sylvestris TaxID=4096 RepID=UPI00388C3C93
MASSSWPAGFGENDVMRPLSGEEENPPQSSAPKHKKERKRKEASSSTNQDEQKPKKRRTRKGDVIPLSMDSVFALRDEPKEGEQEEEKEDDSGLVAHTRASTGARKASEPMGTDIDRSKLDEVEEDASAQVSVLKGVLPQGKEAVEEVVGAELEALRDEENAPSDPLAPIEIIDSPSPPSFSEGMIQEARAMKASSIKGAHEGEDLFYGCFTGIEDIPGSSYLETSRKDSGGAPSLFNEAQQALNWALVLYQEAFSKSRAELSWYETNIQRLTEEKNAFELLSGRKEEEIKSLRDELAVAQKEQNELTEQVVEHAKCQSRRETLEEIHARGFNLVVEIENAKELGAKAKALLFSDDDDPMARM